MKKPKKWMVAGVLAVGMVLAGLDAYAETETVGSVTWGFTVTGGEATVTNAEPASGDLVIPSSLGGFPVTQIGDGAFSWCWDLWSVTIPDSVTDIGEGAFSDCFNWVWGGLYDYSYVEGVERVNIGNGVTNIGNGAFARCELLSEVVWGNNLLSIGAEAFDGCALTSAEIPDSVEEIGDAAFRNCPLANIKIGAGARLVGERAFEWNSGYYYDCSYSYEYSIKAPGLSSISVDERNVAFEVRGGVLFSKDGETLVLCPSQATGPAYAIPDTVKTVRGGAFWYCTNLVSVTIPDAAQSIGNKAFYNCSGLTSIELPDGLARIGEATFYGCTNLASLTFPDSVEEIGDSAFYNCDKLVSLVLPDGVTSIGNQSFYDCDGLESVTLGNCLTNIGSSAFWSCDKLVSLILPGSVTGIGDDAFYYCRGLRELEIPDGVTSIGRGTFRSCSGLTAVSIPGSVTNIGKYAFEYCSGLTSLEIPDSVTDIEAQAFYGCSGLTSLTLGNRVENIGDYAFYNCSSLISLSIPASVVSIGTRAFDGCRALREIAVDGANAAYASEDGVLLSKDKRSLLFCPAGKTGDYSMPAGVAFVQDRAFYNCSNLTSVAMQGGVVDIGSSAFYGCSGLASVAISESATNIGSYAFYGCSGLKTLSIPDGVETIGSYAFSGCSGLGTLEMPASWYGTDKLAETGLRGDCEVTYRGIGKLEVVTETLPAGTVGVAYETTLAASGGVVPYAWSRLDGAYWETARAGTYTDSGTAQGWRDSGSCWELELPFEFPFFGQTYTKAKVSGSGALAFGDSDIAGYTYYASNKIHQTPAIAVDWGYWEQTEVYVENGEGWIKVEWRGGYWVDEWDEWIGTISRNWIRLNCSATLYEDGTIVLSYNDNERRTVGLSAGDGSTMVFPQLERKWTDDIIFEPNGEFPPGLDLTEEGLMKGTPTASGNYAFRVMVTDSDGGVATRMVALPVAQSEVKYPIAMAEGITGGVVRADRNEARPEETVTLTVEPEEGMKLVPGSLKANGMVVDGMTFAMPLEAVTVTAEFAPYRVEVTIGGKVKQWDGRAKGVEVTTKPEGVAVNVTYDGGSTLPRAAGVHDVVATVMDDFYEGCARGTLVIVERGEYLVVDMSGGPEATNWPVTVLDAVPEGGWTDEYKTTKLAMRKVGAGTFLMGSPVDEAGRYGSEGGDGVREDLDETQHWATLEEDFHMGVFEVTRKQYELAMCGRPEGEDGGDRLPVTGGDAAAFAEVLQEKTGHPFGVPTETHWEYACRAGTGTAFNDGKNLDDDCIGETGVFGDAAGCEEVGSRIPNAWGLYDMHGNVWETCQDNRARGGGYHTEARFCRSACRGRLGAIDGDDSMAGEGIRIFCGIKTLYPQTIEWIQIGEVVEGESVELAATATGGGEVVFTVVAGPGKIEGNVLAFTGAGTVVLKAAQAGGGEWAAAEAEQSITVLAAGGDLSLELATGEVRENAGSMRCVVRRTGTTKRALEVRVASSREGDVSVPETVIIAAGAKAASFQAVLLDNGVADGPRTVTLSVEAEKYAGAVAELKVLDDEVPALSLVADWERIREGETKTVWLVRELVGETALTVNLSGVSGNRVRVPGAVTIPAGETMAAFEVTVADDATAQPEKEYTLRASVAGHMAAKWTFLVEDDDVPGVTLELYPEMVSEGAGANAVYATLTRTDAEKGIGEAIRVRLSASPAGQLILPSEMTIPKYTLAVRFPIGTVDNGLDEGTREVTIDGQIVIPSCGCTGQPSSGDAIRATLTVTDNDVPALSLKAEPATMKEGVAEAGWLVLGHNSTLAEDLTVELSFDVGGEIDIPERATIPAGATEVRVPVATLDDGTEDGSKLVSVYAEDPTETFVAASTWLQVSDQNLPDLAVSEVSADAAAVAMRPFAVRFTATNSGFAACAKAVPYAVHMTRSRGVALASNTVVKTGSLDAGLAVGGTLVAGVELTAPEMPGDIWVAVVLDPDGTLSELDNANNTGWSSAVGVAAAYRVTVLADAETYLPGDTITLSGAAELAEGGPAAEADVDVYLMMNGMRRTLKATTGADGTFATTYTPTAGESGHYTVGACYPGVGSQAVQDEFDVLGMRRTSAGNIIWDIALGDTEVRTVTLRNLSASALTGLTATFTGVPEDCNLEWELPESLEGNRSVTLRMTATAAGVTEGVDYEKFGVRIDTDQGVSEEFPLYFHSQTQKAYLRASPGSINTTMAVGHERYVDVTVVNDGKGDSGAVTVTISEARWLKVVSGTTVDNLAPGASMIVTLLLCPETSDGLALNNPLSGGRLAINCANGTGCSVALRFTPVSEATGAIFVDATDNNTYTLESAPHLQNATVRVTNPYTGALVASGITGADGTWRAENIPEGRYQLTITADKHDSFADEIVVEPGTTTRATAFLQCKLVMATWEVVKTEIEDEYEITLLLEYETRVPAPIIRTTMPEDLPTLNEGESYTFTIHVENTGVIRAEKVTLTPPAIGGHTFAFSDNGFELPAGAARDIAVVFERPETGQAGGSSRASVEVTTVTACVYYFTTKTVYPCGKEHPEYSYKIRVRHGLCTNVSSIAVALDNWNDNGGTPSNPGGDKDPERDPYNPIGVIDPPAPAPLEPSPGIIVIKKDCDVCITEMRKALAACGDNDNLKRIAQSYFDRYGGENGCFNHVPWNPEELDEVEVTREMEEDAATAIDAYRRKAPLRDENGKAQKETVLVSIPNPVPGPPPYIMVPQEQTIYTDDDELNIADYGRTRMSRSKTEELTRGMDVEVDDTGSIKTGGTNGDGDGFKASVYEKKDVDGNVIEITIAFAGTDGISKESLNDWWTNIQNGVCQKTTQYKKAAQLLKNTYERYGDSVKIKVTGHSLGGGLAEYAILKNNLGGKVTGVTFDSAGVCRGLLDEIENCEAAKRSIKNFRARNDFVSNLESHSGSIQNVKGAKGHNYWYFTDHPEYADDYHDGYMDSVYDLVSIFSEALGDKIRYKDDNFGFNQTLRNFYNELDKCAPGIFLACDGTHFEGIKEAYLDLLLNGTLEGDYFSTGNAGIDASLSELATIPLFLMAQQNITAGLFMGNDGVSVLADITATRYGYEIAANPDGRAANPAGDGAGDELEWLDATFEELTVLLKETVRVLSTNDHLSAELLASAKPQAVSDVTFANFVSRLDDLDNVSSVGDAHKVMTGLESFAHSRGYPSLMEMWESAERNIRDIVDMESSSVCASVTMKLGQTLAMTREAFDGTLTMHNGNGTTPIRDLKLELSVLDAEGNECRDLFVAFANGTAGDMSGEDVLAGGMTVLAGGTGSARVRFIPERGAAETEEKLYRFGGTVTYTDPFTGERATIQLTPVALTVSPSPYLHLDYFVQRDVYGDDPTTADTVEASLPAELAVLVRNTGGGEARNVTIANVQPEFVLNEKGLAVEFRLSDYSLDASALNGTTAHLGLNTVTLGNIGAGESRVGQWWLTASLQGHFTGMKATVTPLNSWNTPDTALVDPQVGVHRLLRSVEADGDGLPDFLTSEEVGLYGLADTIWTSSGSTLDVAPAGSVAANGALSGRDVVLSVRMETTVRGWTYGWTAIPGADRYDIARVARADGSELPIRNAWITDRVFRDGADPVWETRLHIVDECAAGTQEYTVELSAKAGSGPEVVAFTGIADGSVLEASPDAVEVAFSAPVDSATFGVEDLALWWQGRLLDAPGFGIAGSGTIWTVSGLGEACAADGRYELVVQAAGIAGQDGVWGSSGKSVSWVVCSDTVGPEVLGAMRETGLVGEVFRVSLGEAADAGAVAAGAATLTRNGASVAWPSGATWTDDGGGGLVLSGLGEATAADGMYVLTIFGSGLRDGAGNMGTGSAMVTWTVDTTPPAAVVGLRIDPDLGESDRDGVTCEADVTLRGTLAEDTASVSVAVRYASGDEVVLAGPFSPAGTELAYPITLPGAGNMVLVVRCADAAGNTGETTMGVYLDAIPADATWTTVAEGAWVERAQLRFSARMEAGDVGAERFMLIRNGKLVSLDGVEVLAVEGGLAFELAGLGEVCGETGTYELRFDVSGVRKASSGLVSGSGMVAMAWNYVEPDTEAPRVVEVRIDGELPEAERWDRAGRIEVEFSEAMNVPELMVSGLVGEAFKLFGPDGVVFAEAGEVSWNAESNTAAWALPNGGIGYGEWQLVLDAGLLADEAGNALSGEGWGTAEGLCRFAVEGETFVMVAGQAAPSWGDIDGDGAAELLVGEKTPSGTGDVRIWRNTGTAEAPVWDALGLLENGNMAVEVAATGCLGASVAVADFTGNGHADLVLGTGDGRILAYEGGAVIGTWGDATGLDDGGGEYGAARAVLCAADLAGMGWMSLVAGGLDGRFREIVWWPEDRESPVTTAWLADGRGIPLSVAAGRSAPIIADVNADGLPDVVSGDTRGGLWAFLSDGPDRWCATPVALWLGEPIASEERSRPAWGDADGDGMPDLLVGWADGSVKRHARVASAGPCVDFTVLRTPPTLAEALDAEELEWNVGGDNAWSGVWADGTVGGHAVRADEGSSWMSTTTEHEGRLVFHWRTLGEGWGTLSLVSDGTIVGSWSTVNGGGWHEETFIFGEGTHSLRWVWEGGSGTEAWLDAVAWTASPWTGLDEHARNDFTAWLVEHGLLAAGATVEAITAASFEDIDGDGVDAWGEFVAMTDPNNRLDFLMVNLEAGEGQTIVTWNPHNATDRAYRVFALKRMGGAEDWTDVGTGNNFSGTDWRFFRVGVFLW